MDDSQAACVDMASGKSEAFVYCGRCDWSVTYEFFRAKRPQLAI